MAISVTQANAVSTAVYDKKLVQSVYDDSYFFAKLRKDEKVIQSGGNDIRFPVRYKALGTGGEVDWDDQVAFQAISTRTSGVLDWKPYRAETMLTWEERSKNQSGPRQIVNLMKDKAEELKEEIQDKLFTDLFATTAVSGKISSLDEIVDAADTYAGIAVADAAVWAAIEDSTSTTLTRKVLNATREQALFGTKMPNAHITSRSAAGWYDNLLGANERYTNTEAANLGFANVTFYGDPVIGDAFCPTAYWYGLDMDSLEIHVLKGNDMTVSQWEDLFVAGFPDSFGKVVKSVCNIVCRRRKTNFKFSALTGT